MRLKRKMTISFVAIISFFLISCNLITFFTFKEIYSDKVISSQQAAIYNNKNTLNFFFESINQVCVQLSGSHTLGEVASLAYAPYTLRQFEARNSLVQQFTQSTNVLFSVGSYTYTSMFFLNDQLSLADSYYPDVLQRDRKNRSGVFRDSAVKEQDWYKRAAENNSRYHVFVSKENNELCMVKRIDSAYYTGPRLEGGIGVIVIILDSRQLETIFKLSKITANSNFIITNADNSIIYSSRGEEVPLSTDEIKALMERKRTTNDFENNASQTITLKGKPYIVNLEQTKWGLGLLFLTPSSDVTDQLVPIIRFILICTGSVILLCALSIFLVTRAIAKPILLLSGKMSVIGDSRTVDLSEFKTKAKDEVGTLYRSFSDLLDRNNRLIGDVQLRTTQKKEAELKTLQAQINPHFMFNAMDVVNWIALSRDQDDIADIVDTIASMMRYSITNPNDMVPLAEEMDNIAHYMKIQLLRFGERIHLKAGLDPKLLSLLVPKFILQPLVENCILHGLRDSESEIDIAVRAEQCEGKLAIYVSDNGKGCDVDKLNAFLAGEETDLVVSSGFGVGNINDRIQLKFPGGSGLSYKLEEDGGFTAVVTIYLGEARA